MKIYIDNKEEYLTVEEFKNPDVIEELKVVGKTYSERKDCLTNIAIFVQNLLADYTTDWYSLIAIQSWFRDMGRKYGLIREFKENCIC